MNLNLGELISYIIAVAGIAGIAFGYLSKIDTKHAKLWTDLKNAADAIVAQQAVTNKPNEQKKEQATQDLLNQMDKLGHKKVDEVTAQGEIEKAVQRSKDSYAKPPLTPAKEELLDDLHV